MNQSSYLPAFERDILFYVYLYGRARLFTDNKLLRYREHSAKRDVAAFACYLLLFREITLPLRSQKARDRACTMVLSVRSLVRALRALELFIALNHRSAALGSS